MFEKKALEAIFISGRREGGNKKWDSYRRKRLVSCRTVLLSRVSEAERVDKKQSLDGGKEICIASVMLVRKPQEEKLRYGSIRGWM